MMTLQEIQEFFKNDRFATENGAVVETAEDGFARCSLALGPSHKNAVGGIMGGVPFTLADFAFAVASNCAGTPVTSLTSQIAFLSQPKGKILAAEARRVRQGRNTCYYQVSVSDDLGTMVAEVTITGYLLSK